MSTLKQQLEGGLFLSSMISMSMQGIGGFGGFEGNSYKKVYNDYRGFPGPQSGVQTVPSVPWKDSGLPLTTSINPYRS